ncbi:hypothetical protein SAMN04488564_112261 [Lentzea waywayandensis]|uniref:Uncharacterized protein n=1 Tax=Lentzea waywayandensis TaxID=84724 RepID=A0A1I6FE00_9PSEU|nr:hypothetical protein [Lentzea waywayandensis]SFR28150.1 hypothetical protein SAMN04488564_112261 [Lentzea waywayandensis]
MSVKTGQAQLYVRWMQEVRYDRARKNLDRHPNYILAACMASAT